MISLKLRIVREKNRLYSQLLKLLHRLQPDYTTVFLFHDLLDTKEDVKSIFAISQGFFEAFLTKKIQMGWMPISYSELKAIISKEKSRKGKQFIVTFDDANTSVFTKAYPFLKAKGIPFIIFITKGLVGKPNFLTEEQIKILAADPLCTVGSHGLNHVMFRYLTPDVAAVEYKESRYYLEELTGTTVDCFAFPYGRVVECSRKNIDVLKHSEYDFGFSAIAGNLGQQWLSGKYYLSRVNVDEGMVGKVMND